MQLSEIVPWGRTLQEYKAMFALTEADMTNRILGCGDGPASFNAEGTLLGVRIVSIDPLYQFDGSSIAQRFAEVAPTIIDQLRANQARWIWTHFKNPDELLAGRRTALDRFLADYESGRAAGRYLEASLPTLPFDNQAFGLAVCSHLLFLYADLLSEEFHVQAVNELCRVAREVRIFPLLTLAQDRSPHVAAVCAAVSSRGFRARITTVPYEFQPGGDEMLVISPA